MGYLFAAYAVFWALTFALVLDAYLRLRRLEREVRTLREGMEKGERG